MLRLQCDGRIDSNFLLPQADSENLKTAWRTELSKQLGQNETALILADLSQYKASMAISNRFSRSLGRVLAEEEMTLH